MKPSLLPLLAFAASALHAGTPAIVTASAKNAKAPMDCVLMPPSSSWRISAGPQWRTLGDASFNNSTQAPAYILPRFGSSSSTIGGGGAYTDGYVLPDISGSSTSTWNFGFNSASQIQGTSLVFTGSSVSLITETFSHTFNSDWDDAMSGWGGFVKVESPELYDWRGISLSAAIGYSFTRADIDHSTRAFTATQRTTNGGGTFTDTYAAIGALPPAPHAGTFAGPGPVISLVPVRHFSSGGSGGETVSETSVESIIRNELNVDLHTLSFGPQFTFNTIVPKLTLGGSLGLALNLADWDASTDETLSTTEGDTLARWHAENSGTEVLPGLYIEANAAYALNAKWSVNAFSRYDWSEALKGHTGTSSFELDLTGWTVGAGATYRF